LAPHRPPDHHADDVADVPHLHAVVALAADRADQAPAHPRAENELPAVVVVEPEAMQIVARHLGRFGGCVGGEGLRVGGEHLVAQPLVLGEVGRDQRADDERVAHPPM